MNHKKKLNNLFYDERNLKFIKGVIFLYHRELDIEGG